MKRWTMGPSWPEYLYMRVSGYHGAKHIPYTLAAQTNLCHVHPGLYAHCVEQFGSMLGMAVAHLL